MENAGFTENADLYEECADWIAAQMEEENVFVDPGLIALIFAIEREAGAEAAASRERAAAIEATLVERGVAGAPDTIDAALIYNILDWEDEFLGLAGRPRPR